MKPIKETKLGKFLKEKAPKVLDVVGDLLPDKGVLGIVKNLISSDSDIKPEDRIEYTKLEQEFELEVMRMEQQDRESARNMQIEALKQNDVFSKRFIYYLASFVMLSSVAYGFILLYIEVPEANKRLVEQFADMFLLTGALMVLGFFFSSSKSSQDKSEVLSSVMRNKAS